MLIQFLKVFWIKRNNEKNMNSSKTYRINFDIKLVLRILLVIVLFINLSFSCDGTLKEKYLFEEITIMDTVITDNNNSILQLDIEFPSKFKNKLTYIEFQPLLIIKQNDTLNLKPYKIQGEKVKDNYEIVPYEKGKTISYIDTFRIESNYAFDKLILKVDFMNYGKINSDITEYYIIHNYQ